ncbi:MAG TPA: hypothetical protein VEK12_20155 [Alphaproteobacteria bacterium]|nr:hypothetical protein [Alphaproteobacteria bacterium]
MKAFIAAIVAAVLIGVIAAVVLDNMGMSSAQVFSGEHVRL